MIVVLSAAHAISGRVCHRVPFGYHAGVAPRIICCVNCERWRPVHARELCHSCYDTICRSNQLDSFTRRTTTSEEWWALIDKSDPSACWPWPGPVNSHGYGHYLGRSAHRWAFEQFVGPIPEGMELDHTCHTRNPCG